MDDANGMCLRVAQYPKFFLSFYLGNPRLVSLPIYPEGIKMNQDLRFIFQNLLIPLLSDVTAHIGRPVTPVSFPVPTFKLYYHFWECFGF